MKHPDLEFARKTIDQVLLKKRFAGWHILDIAFQFMESQYQIKFSNDEKELTVPIFTGLFDEYEKNPSMITLKKIKDKLKQQLIPHDSSDED